MAAAAKVEQAGNEQYQGKHMSAIFQEGFSFSGFERDFLCLNLANKKFMDISGVSGADSISDGRGAVFADFDNDGDLDIFLTTVQGEAHLLFRNNVGQENGFIRIQLEGVQSGRDAYGALVRVKTSTGTLTKIKAGGSGYVSQHDPRLVFGLGQDRAAEWVEVTWPSGNTQRFYKVATGIALKIIEGKKELMEVAERRFRLVDPLSREDALLAKLNIRKGEAFPDLKLRTLTNHATSLRALLKPDQRYFVNLWATYCIPCRKEMPELQRLYPEFRAANIEILGVSLDMDTARLVPNFLNDHNIHYPIFITDEASIRKIFAGEQVLIPMSFLLDDQGRLLEVFAGWSGSSQRKIHGLLAATGGAR